MAAFSHQWEEITENKFILRTIADGYAIEFSNRPPTKYLATMLPKDSNQAKVFLESLQKLLDQKVICHVPQEEEQKGFYSHIFAKRKPSGKLRLILNLKPLNRGIRYKRFRMESIYSIRNILPQETFMATLDLQDAYLHVPIRKDHQRFLRFAIQGPAATLHLQYTALPFGISSAPRIFSKIMAEALKGLRQEGIGIIPYLDDLLFFADSAAILENNLRKSMIYLQNLGWLINAEKSQMIPSQRVVYLGYVLDSRLSKIFLTKEKDVKMTQAITSLLRNHSTTIRHGMSVLGLMTSSIPAITWAQIHMRPLQNYILSQWDGRQASLEKSIPVPATVKQTLYWWLNPLRVIEGRRWAQVNPVSITTDASALGWGAHMEGRFSQGKWTPKWAQASSNLRELKAVGEALKTFKPALQGKDVKIQSDNATTVAYLNRQGGTKSQKLMRLTQSILLWTEVNIRSISGIHLKGTDNTVADFLSRKTIKHTEWSLNQTTFTQITQKWGIPEVDLFASRANAKSPIFFSLDPTDGNSGVDAFNQNWKWHLCYAFPPTAIIPKVIQKIKAEKTTVILIAPHWPQRAWFSHLKNLSIQPQLTLTDRPDLLSQGPVNHPNHKILKLSAWLLRG